MAGLRRPASLDQASDGQIFVLVPEKFPCGRRLERRLFREQVSGGPLIPFPATDGATVLG